MNRNRMWALIAAAVVVLAVVIGVFSVPRKDIIAAGVRAGGIKIGKLTADDAENLLKEKLKGSPVGSVQIEIDGMKKDISLEAGDLSYDFGDTVKGAMAVGRQGNAVVRAWEGFLAHLGCKKIEVTVIYDTEKFAEYIDEKIKDTGTPVTEYTYELGENSIKITNGKPGDIPDASEVAADIAKAVGMGRTDKPIKYRKKMRDPESVDIDELYEKLHSEAKNAEYIVADGKVTVRDHKVFVDFDKAAAKKIADSKKGYSESFEIPATIKLPELTKQMAEERIFADVLGQYSTRYNSGDTSRSENIALAAKSIDGKVLAAGEVFSYNGTVGERTGERGYKNAKVFVNGESVDGIGGGICQVSTTLYNAALYADVQIVERMNHQLPVGYVPLGQDATVFYGSIDFKFKNSTNYPIKIVSNAGGGTLNIKILGYKEDKSLHVIIENETISVSEPKVKEIKDNTLPVGETRVEKKGASGAVVDTFKTVVRDGADPVRKRISRSVYNPTVQEVRVGTAPLSETTDGTAPENTEVPSAEPEEGGLPENINQ